MGLLSRLTRKAAGTEPAAFRLPSHSPCGLEPLRHILVTGTDAHLRTATLNSMLSTRTFGIRTETFAASTEIHGDAFPDRGPDVVYIPGEEGVYVAVSAVYAIYRHRLDRYCQSEDRPGFEERQPSQPSIVLMLDCPDVLHNAPDMGAVIDQVRTPVISPWPLICQQMTEMLLMGRVFGVIVAASAPYASRLNERIQVSFQVLHVKDGGAPLAITPDDAEWYGLRNPAP